MNEPLIYVISGEKSRETSRGKVGKKVGKKIKKKVGKKLKGEKKVGKGEIEHKNLHGTYWAP